MLDGIRMVLQPHFDLIETVQDGRSLLTAAAAIKPDAILLDISMPVLNGIDAAHQLRKVAPSSKLIFVTMHADADYVTAAFRAGASGYVLKRSAASELLIAIREVLRGHRYVSPAVTGDTLELLMNRPGAGGLFSSELTPREREVLQMVAEGRTRKEIAATLAISIKTVEFHKTKLMQKLHLRSSADFTLYAVRHGLILSERLDPGSGSAEQEFS
jgi:DNA-binding NarL/FixJ family response regulator